MENWGLITYRETALLNKETTTSEIMKESQGFTIAHEMGHQVGQLHEYSTHNYEYTTTKIIL